MKLRLRQHKVNYLFRCIYFDHVLGIHYISKENYVYDQFDTCDMHINTNDDFLEKQNAFEIHST